MAWDGPGSDPEKDVDRRYEERRLDGGDPLRNALLARTVPVDVDDVALAEEVCREEGHRSLANRLHKARTGVER